MKKLVVFILTVSNSCVITACRLVDVPEPLPVSSFKEHNSFPLGLPKAAQEVVPIAAVEHQALDEYTSEMPLACMDDVAVDHSKGFFEQEKKSRFGSMSEAFMVNRAADQMAQKLRVKRFDHTHKDRYYRARKAYRGSMQKLLNLKGRRETIRKEMRRKARHYTEQYMLA